MLRKNKSYDTYQHDEDKHAAGVEALICRMEFLASTQDQNSKPERRETRQKCLNWYDKFIVHGRCSKRPWQGLNLTGTLTRQAIFMWRVSFETTLLMTFNIYVYPSKNDVHYLFLPVKKYVSHRSPLLKSTMAFMHRNESTLSDSA